MTFHHTPMPPARIVALGGPVTRALAVMRAAEPETDRTRLRALRKAIADRIEADIALLDALAGDVDLEDGGDDEPSLCGLLVSEPGYPATLRGCGGDPVDLEDDRADFEPEDSIATTRSMAQWQADRARGGL